MSTEQLLTVLTIVASSTLLAAFASNWQKVRQKRRELIAGATKSALKRVEMYYRVKRRLKDDSENTQLRDRFHDIQEENDYYIALLDQEAPWLGLAYRRFIAALKRELQPFMTEAWGEKKTKPSVQLKGQSMPDVDRYVQQFSKDSRRLFNPVMRPLMRARYMLRNIWKGSLYDN